MNVNKATSISHFAVFGVGLPTPAHGGLDRMGTPTALEMVLAFSMNK